jgi:hypothetical protein
MKAKRMFLILGIVLTAAAFAAAQAVETVDGVRVIHNKKGGQWKNEAKVRLTPVLKLGDLETEDENFVFARPVSVVVDESGRIYVLDSQEGRIQKYDKDGKYLATLGRKGQGPGEFQVPSGLALDLDGSLIVSDLRNRTKVWLSPEGRYLKSVDLSAPMIPLPAGGFLAGLPLVGMRVSSSGGAMGAPVQENSMAKKLLRVLDASMKTIREFADPVAKEDDMSSQAYNRFRFALDGLNHVVLAFGSQNRIEKYSLDGRLLWRADRELNYPLGLGKAPVGAPRAGANMVSMPNFVSCGNGVAVDGRGRIWVLTMNRQFKESEMLRTMASIGGGTQRQGDFTNRKTDVYKFEIFDGQGVLLGEIPWTTYIDNWAIFGDKLFLIDSNRGLCVEEYKIEEIG